MTPLPRPQGEHKLFNLKDKPATDKPRLIAPGILHTENYGHSQFSGSWTYKITRIDDKTGDVYGVYHSGDVCEMDIEDVM